MSCTDHRRAWPGRARTGADPALPDPGRRSVAAAVLLAGWSGLVVLTQAGCSVPRQAPRPQPVPAPVPPAPAPSGPAAPPAPVPAPAAGAARPARTWDEYRIAAARRIVQMNPGRTYLTTPPEPLLAIPVLEIELYVDGSIAAIRVERRPSQAPETIQMAIDAVRRAAPFGPVGHLPKPWRFSEVFLFDDERRFKPVSLD